MRVLVGCERSGKVRDAFRRLGHEAWSCDLESAEGAYLDYHHRGDVVDFLRNSTFWDLVILHPECTAMALSGNRHYGDYGPRHAERQAALKWTKELIRLAKTRTRRLCVENPRSALWSVVSGRIQWIQPWQFGHPERKETGLLLWNLPPLKPRTDESILEGVSRKAQDRVLLMGGDKNQKRNRSETYDGVAAAMAEDWGGLDGVR